MGQRLGQHFLKDKGAIRTIIAALELAEGDCVIEVGAGRGALTDPLARRCASVGARLIAIEKDELLAQKLEMRNEKLEIMQGDALKILSDLVWKLEIVPPHYLDFSIRKAGSRHGGRNWKLAGNIPYYITGKLLRTIGELAEKPSRTVLTLQREVAERIAAEPPRMNLLAASVQIWARPKILRSLAPSAFSPRPKVTSAIILLETRESLPSDEELHRYYRLIHRIFRQPRKTVWNNLRSGGSGGGEATRSALEKLGLTGRERPQDLNVPLLIKLAELLVV